MPSPVERAQRILQKQAVCRSYELEQVGLTRAQIRRLLDRRASMEYHIGHRGYRKGAPFCFPHTLSLWLEDGRVVKVTHGDDY